MNTRTTAGARFATSLIVIASASAACSTGDDAPMQQVGNSPTSGFPEPGAGDAAADAGVLPDAPQSAADGASDVVGDGPSALFGSLVALTSHCNVASTGKYKAWGSSVATVDVCRLNGAYFWKSGMGIDCDGQSTVECNANSAPGYSSQTTFTQSNGRPLVSAQTSYYVIPIPTSRFNYRTAGIKGGAVGLVLYGATMRYGVFGDEGAADEIGFASYRTASAMGINPSPTTGGVGAGVTYIVFTGAGAVPAALEDHTAATTLGEQLTTVLLQNN